MNTTNRSAFDDQSIEWFSKMSRRRRTLAIALALLALLAAYGIVGTLDLTDAEVAASIEAAAQSVVTQ